jgi:hypothetical protein
MVRYSKSLARTSTVLDADRGQSTPQSKSAIPISLEDAAHREDDRAGLRDLDARLERAHGLTRAQRDAQRISPRDAAADIDHPMKERRLLAPGTTRQPLSGRQQKARRKAALAVLNKLPSTQYRALTDLMDEGSGGWARINDQLSASAGDIEALSERDTAGVRRLDRAIQACEAATDRGHVVYANVRLPTAINRSNIEAYTQRQYQPGDEVAFDRYTGAAHSLHEITPVDDPAGRVAVFEIQTRRGIYLGKSEGSDDSAHLLPRGMQLRVVGVHHATYQGRAGEQGSRMVIQLVDATPEPARRSEQ